MNARSPAIAAIIFIATLPAPAAARPKYAARAGTECTFCHVSPSGAGVRNRYGSHVFQRTQLPLELGGGDAAAEDDDPSTDAAEVRRALSAPSFSGAITDWLTLGADLRVSYLLSKPERSAIPDADPQITSTFFLMQADLYAAAQLGPHLAFVLDLGAYTGFEAWFLARAASEPSTFDLYAKVGRFIPAFGIRDVNHDLYSRAGIGFDAIDRDTGVEVTGVAGPVTLSLALVNGTFEDAPLDTRGTGGRSFEKALVSRATVRFSLSEYLNIQVGGSIYLNDNVDAANPLFESALSDEEAELASSGVDELRAGGFLTANLGRITYLGEFIFVRDTFTTGSARAIQGYASAQELDVLIVQGVALSATLEFMEPDIDVSDNTRLRAGINLEFFPSAFVELRATARQTFSTNAPAGDTTDVLLFAHAFF